MIVDVAQAVTQAVVDTVHRGELSGALVTYIAGGAATLARILSMFFPTEKSKLIATIVISSVLLWSWAFSNYAWSREGAFPLVMGWIGILAACAGMLASTNPVNLSAALNTVSGGRAGTPKE